MMILNAKEHEEMVSFQRKKKTHFTFFLISMCICASPSYAEQTTPQPTVNFIFGLTPPTDFNWAGTYIGGFLGGAFANTDPTTNAGAVNASSYFSSAADIASVNHSGSNSLNTNAPMFGIQIGDNFYTNRLYVIGAVVDYSPLHFNEHNTVNNVAYPSGAGNYSLQTSMSTDWMYTFRGRFGYLAPSAWPMMVYATGGLAITNINVTNSLSDTSSLSGRGASNGSNNQTGWTLGAGVELPLMQHLTVNAEYLYVSLGTVNSNGSIQNSAGGFGIPVNSLTSSFSTSTNLHANLVRLGLNYKF